MDSFEWQGWLTSYPARDISRVLRIPLGFANQTSRWNELKGALNQGVEDVELNGGILTRARNRHFSNA